MKWYDIICGGRKAYQGILAAICGIIVWYSITMETRAINLTQILVYFLVVFGFYILGNLKEHQINGKSANGGK